MKLQKSKKAEFSLSEDLKTDDEWSDCVFKQVQGGLQKRGNVKKHVNFILVILYANSVHEESFRAEGNII